MYLQHQYASLIVNKDFGQNTARVFRSLQSNTSAFPKESLDNLKAAVQLTGCQTENQNTGNYNNFRGRGRGYGRGYRGYFRGRGRGDVFDQLSRDVPQSRPQHDTD